MSRFLAPALTVLIVTSFVYAHQKKSKTNESLNNVNKLAQECILAQYVSKKQSATKMRERIHHTDTHNLVILLLLCSGDIQLNPGPVTATYFSKKLKSGQRVILSRLISTQKKYIESMLHGRFLKQYAEENVPPPGLKFRKTAQIRYNQDLNSTWQHMLDETSMNLTETLIKSHERNTILLAKRMTSLRNQVMECLNEAYQKQLQQWLQKRCNVYAISFLRRNKINK